MGQAMASGASGMNGDIHGATTTVPRLTRLEVQASLLAAASAVLWAVLIAGLWVTIPPCVLHLVQPGAATVTVTAILLWVGAGNVRQREASRGVLIDTVANLTRPAGRQTGPLRLRRVP